MNDDAADRIAAALERTAVANERVAESWLLQHEIERIRLAQLTEQHAQLTEQHEVTMKLRALEIERLEFLKEPVRLMLGTEEPKP